MIERLRQLETVSRRLDPGPEARAAARDAVVGYSESFLEALHSRRAYEIDKRAARKLRDAPIPEEGADLTGLLELWAEAVDAPGLSPPSAGHMAYIPGGGLYYSALGDYLAAVTNRYVGVRFASPGAVEMEESVLEWMAGVVGYPAGWGGVLTAGGSVANLIAVVAARDAAGLRPADFERAVVYLTEHVHNCVDKALRIAGMGGCVQRRVAMDEGYRMVPEALERAIAADRETGLVPWLVVASAGTTDVGAIDPLVPIGEVAKAAGLWYHVDAAYGGFFALVPELAPRLAGMELSDTVVLDPHKGLFLPFGIGALLARDKAALYRAFSYHAHYMQDTLDEASLEEASPGDLSLEFSKHFRGPRAWLPLQVHGVSTFRAALEEKHLLARYFRERVVELGFEVGPEPELSVVTYRYVPPDGDANDFNRALVEAIHEDGRVFVSSTMLGDRFVLRVAVVTFRTHLDTVDLYLRILAEKVEALLGAARPGASGR